MILNLRSDITEVWLKSSYIAWAAVFLQEASRVMPNTSFSAPNLSDSLWL